MARLRLAGLALAEAPVAQQMEAIRVAIDALEDNLGEYRVNMKVNELVTRANSSQAAAQANSTAVDVAGLVTDFNALLTKLRAAGILAP